MIITLTGNLLAERTFVCDGWRPGKTQRASAELFQVGGKGINVTKMLSRIGESTTAWCFVGGASGGECASWLRERALPHRTFTTTATTRTGLVVRDDSGQTRETTFLGRDNPVDHAALLACAEALAQERGQGGVVKETSHASTPSGTQTSQSLRAEDVRQSIASPTRLALCGSFPGWASDDAGELRKEIALWARSDRLAIDSYGPPLRWALNEPVSLVKINRDEFLALFEDDERDQPMDTLLGLACSRWPVRAWVITDGPNEVFFADRADQIGRTIPPAVKEVSATGSGDVVFACLLHALYTLEKPLAEAVAFALPYGAANAADSGVAEFALNNLPGARSFPK